LTVRSDYASVRCRRPSAAVPRPGEVVRVKLPPKRPPPEWLERAKTLYAEGRTLEQVGEAVGTSGSSVSKHLKRAGIPVRTPTESQQLAAGRGGKPAWLAEAIRLYAEGKNLVEVAREVNISAQHVGKVFHDEGVVMRPRPAAKATEDQRHDIVLLSRNGRPAEWIAATLKLTVQAVKNALDYAARHPAGEAGSDTGQTGQP
jgi:DNA-binding CsgD family transcriptional regulator